MVDVPKQVKELHGKAASSSYDASHYGSTQVSHTARGPKAAQGEIAP